MFQMLRRTLRKTPARFLYHWAKSHAPGRSQSDESQIMLNLLVSEGAPPTFVEFGFHPTEFNCIALRDRARGLLIDGDESTVMLAKSLLPDNVQAVHRFLVLENLDFIRTKFDRLGVLSIDVDGNDYWFLKALIEIQPTIICVEYNASLGLRPLSVPYEATFDRHKHHSSGWYHGASLSALAKLCAGYGYGLNAISAGGMNAFFTHRGTLDPKAAWRPNAPRERWSGKSTAEQWDAIKSMPYIEV